MPDAMQDAPLRDALMTVAQSIEGGQGDVVTALEAITIVLGTMDARLARLEGRVPRGDPRDAAPDLAKGWGNNADIPHRR